MSRLLTTRIRAAFEIGHSFHRALCGTPRPPTRSRPRTEPGCGSTPELCASVCFESFGARPSDARMLCRVRVSRCRVRVPRSAFSHNLHARGWQPVLTCGVNRMSTAVQRPGSQPTMYRANITTNSQLGAADENGRSLEPQMIDVLSGLRMHLQQAAAARAEADAGGGNPARHSQA